MTGAWTSLWVLPLVAFLGYTFHQASMCTIMAVPCAIRERRYGLLKAFGRTVLWAMVPIVPATATFPVCWSADTPPVSRIYRDGCGR